MMDVALLIIENTTMGFRIKKKKTLFFAQRTQLPTTRHPDRLELTSAAEFAVEHSIGDDEMTVATTINCRQTCAAALLCCRSRIVCTYGTGVDIYILQVCRSVCAENLSATRKNSSILLPHEGASLPVTNPLDETHINSLLTSHASSLFTPSLPHDRDSAGSWCSHAWMYRTSHVPEVRTRKLKLFKFPIMLV